MHKKISTIFVGFLAALLVFVAVVGAAPVRAASLSTSQIQAVVQLLQSFGVDSGLIQSVANTLGSSASPVPPGNFCPTLSYNLYVGLSDNVTGTQVSQLQRYLGVSPTGYFGLQTRAAVAHFQAQNSVYPVTGGVGPLTRAAIARLCSGMGGEIVSAPMIQSITPTQGPVGTQITITGWGFTSDNTIRFGSGGAMHVSSSNNGTVLSFVVPNYVGPCDYVGDTSAVHCMIAVQQVVPGTYGLSVSNENGQSNTLSFTVTGASAMGLSVTQPTANQVFVRGQDMTIAWAAGSNTPITAAAVVDLYTEVGNKVGTIAIANLGAGSFVWHVPGFPQNYMCTMQYPNGLCGVNIPTGRYYVKVTAVANGFDQNATQYGSANSGVFTINQQ